MVVSAYLATINTSNPSSWNPEYFPISFTVLGWGGKWALLSHKQPFCHTAYAYDICYLITCLIWVENSSQHTSNTTNTLPPAHQYPTASTIILPTILCLNVGQAAMLWALKTHTLRLVVCDGCRLGGRLAHCMNLWSMVVNSLFAMCASECSHAGVTGEGCCSEFTAWKKCYMCSHC